MLVMGFSFVLLANLKVVILLSLDRLEVDSM